MANPPRRVVTGHTPDGVSIVVSDGPIPVTREIPADGVAFHEIWNTSGTPARITGAFEEPTTVDLTVPPPPGGTKIRINEFAPGHLDDRGLQSPMHRTASIDYGIVLEGEITLILDDSEVTLSTGDVVVQRGTDHAWANRGPVPAKIVFVLIDGEFDPSLAGGISGLMRGGPRD